MEILKKKKRVKPRMVPLTDDSNEVEDNGRVNDNDNSQLISPVENRHDYGTRETTVSEDAPSSPPSAPPEEEYVPIGLQNDKIRRKFLQKVYGVLCAQMTLFGALTALFVYVPHMRKIIRKNFFDRLFLSSIIGVPLCIFMALLLIFSKLRRRFAWTTITILTISLSLLLSYTLTHQSAGAFLYSIGASDICCAGIIGASFGKNMDFTSWKLIPTVPTVMTVSSILSPTILGTTVKSTLVPSIIMSSLMTYLTLNTRPVIRHNDLKIEPHEYLFAASQLYIQPEQYVKHKLRSWICGSEPNRRQSYQQI